MAASNFRLKRHERSDHQKYMEHNFTCTVGGTESIMKFSPQRLESPPLKPPRRRYSDQLSVQSLGSYSSVKKTNNDDQRNDLMLKKYNPKPAYLSLPANLTSDALTECDSTSNLLSDPHSLSDQLKQSRENEFYGKSFLDNLKVYESYVKQSYSTNRYFTKEKSQSIKTETNNDNTFSKYQYEYCAPATVDRLSKNSTSNNKVFITNACINQNLKPFHKECYRRRHSDPAISYFNLQNDNSLKSSYEQCSDSTPYFTKKVNKNCDFAGSCCKRNYFIMQEIRTLKEMNDKLWHHLCSLQTCLDNSRKKTSDACADVSVSGLLSSIYYAQKTKDSAMEARLKFVLEERDTALRELDDLIHILSKRFDFADGEKINKDIKELLGDMGSTMNPSTFLKYQSMLLNQIHNFKESKQDCLSQKVKQAVIERDNALEKIKNLEEEVKDLKLSYDLWHSDNKQWEFTMFDIMSQVLHQRDTLLSNIDNGFDIGNVIYRPLASNKLDSIEHKTVSPYDCHSKTIELLKNHQSMHFNDKQQHSISTPDEVRKLKEEVILLKKALGVEREKMEHTEEKCFRLERLIHVLRKKLNGQNVGVPV